jgi:predicted O-methyltransferase YrrM
MKHPATRNWRDLQGELAGIINSRDCIDNRCHLSYLAEVAHGNVLEIGVDVGHSTTALLLGIENNGGHLYSIDINPFCANVFDECPFWTFTRGNSGYTDFIEGIKFDVAYIDGDHSYEGIKRDLEKVLPAMKPTSLILIHDVDAVTPPNVFPGVLQAFNEVKVGTKHIRYGDNGLGVIQLG